MEKKSSIRKPKQARGKNTKEKIIKTAIKVFSEYGYYQTTTIELAKAANVSIGCFYSYFKDKDSIFLEILNRYDEKFIKMTNEMIKSENLYINNPKGWIRTLIQNLIKMHQELKKLNSELNVLYYSHPDVAKILDTQQEEARKISLKYFDIIQDDLKVTDIDAASIIAYDFVDAIVHQVIYGKSNLDKNRIIEAGVAAIYKYLIG
ncbi:TetR/AcrR family transcriptional regulator [Clostridium felsineum]|uniref:TetR/AcrR family transcriptional regulator n=1 Tax=Clostridium felsineum TaxID=36839 RepID=UPI00214D46FC|nr:TetR/AcrR family transcriptional regulator [Clostridium felsineum]MCR3758480.1 TetR/AcrR family transcriptional regulator [Clostridium felsineum]